MTAVISPVRSVDYADGRHCWHVRLPYERPPLTANQRMHHMQRARIVRQVRNDVATLARSLPKLDKVAVELHWVPARGGRRDEENLAPLLKACIDALTPQRVTKRGVHVGAGVIPDDTPQHVESATCHIDPPSKENPHLYLVIWRRS